MGLWTQSLQLTYKRTTSLIFNQGHLATLTTTTGGDIRAVDKNSSKGLHQTIVVLPDTLATDVHSRHMPFITLGMTVPFEATGIAPPPPGIHPLPMSRPQVGIERLPARRMSNEPRESMNCKSCRKRKVRELRSDGSLNCPCSSLAGSHPSMSD